MSEKEEKRTRTTIEVDKNVWKEVRREAYEKGTTTSVVVERVLREGLLKPEKKDKPEGS